MAFPFHLRHHFQRSVGTCRVTVHTAHLWTEVRRSLHPQLPSMWPRGLQFKWALQGTCGHSAVENHCESVLVFFCLMKSF